MSEWISVKKELPAHNKRVLLTNRNEIWVGYRSYDLFETCITVSHSTCYLELGEVTHWMPLPELPKEDL